jgi:hypothetical protein
MPDMDPKQTFEMIARARAEAVRVASEALGKPTAVEVLETDWSWTDLRMRHRLHGRVHERLSTASITISPDGREAGWVVDSRKQRAILLDLDPASVEAIARAHPSISPSMRLESQKPVALDDDKRMIVCRFSPAADGKAREVLVSPGMKEIIGVLAVLEGPRKAVPTDDAHAKHALALARAKVTADLVARVGPLAAQDSEKLIHITADRGGVDPAGWRVYDLTLWSFFSMVDVTNDVGQDEPGGWHLEALGEEAPEPRLDEPGVVEIATPYLLAKEGVAGPRVEFSESRGRHRASVLWWHVERGLVVEGDQTMVYVNAWDGKVFSVARRWRKIDPQLFDQEKVGADEAIKIVEKDRKDLNIDPRAKGRIIDRAIIEASFDPSLPVPPRDVIAWRIGYRRPDHPAFAEVAVDQATGRIVRVTGW